MVWKDSSLPTPLGAPFQHWISSQPLQEGEEGDVERHRHIYTMQNFQGEERRAKKRPTQGLKSNGISNELLWEKEKRALMRNPNKLSVFKTVGSLSFKSKFTGRKLEILSIAVLLWKAFPVNKHYLT